MLVFVGQGFSSLVQEVRDCVQKAAFPAKAAIFPLKATGDWSFFLSSEHLFPWVIFLVRCISFYEAMSKCSLELNIEFPHPLRERGGWGAVTIDTLREHVAAAADQDLLSCYANLREVSREYAFVGGLDTVEKLREQLRKRQKIWAGGISCFFFAFSSLCHSCTYM